MATLRKMEIIVDTREQRPLFTGDRYTRWGLLVGDYTTRLLFYSYAIERKSLQDLCGTITNGNGRFHRELLRAKVNGIKLVMVVEGTRKNFIAKKFPHGDQRKISGEVLNKIITTFETKHGLEVHWCCSRQQAIRKIRTLFKIEEALIPTRNGVKKN